MNILSKQDVQRIKAEHQRYLDNEDTLHNQTLHQRILATWKADSPAMYLRLRTQGVLEAMAFVCQQRMWEEQDLLIKAGMQVTDACEQAEREHLMLGPEVLPLDNGDLPDVLQDASPHLQEKWRAELERLGLLGKL